MPGLHRAGVAATAFIFSVEKHSNFDGSLSKRLPSVPVTALKVGSPLDFMVGRGLTERESCPGIGGDYPHAFILGGGRNYASIVVEVQNGLQQLAILANLIAAMHAVVGIQDSRTKVQRSSLLSPAEKA